MATTNLSTQSLGDISIQSGTGTPNHAAPRGSLYTDIATGFQYINLTGAAVWSELVLSAFGELYITTTTTLSPSTVGWTAITTNTALRNTSGFSFSSGALLVDSGYAGTYGALLTMTVQRNATSTTYTGGISVNSVPPGVGQTGSTSVDTTRLAGNLSVYTTLTLVPTDTINIVIQALAAGNVNVLFTNLILWRKGD